MNDLPNPNAPSNDWDSPDGSDFDPTLDALIEEAVKGSRPPDLKHDILAQLRATASQHGVAAPPVVRADTDPNTGTALRNVLVTFAVAVSIFIVAILVRRQTDVDVEKPGVNEIADGDVDRPTRSGSSGSQRSPAGPDARSLAKDIPDENPAMDGDGGSPSQGSVDSIAGDASTPRTLSEPTRSSDASTSLDGAVAPSDDRVRLADLLKEMPAQEFELQDGGEVSAAVETTLVGYWSSIGVVPTPPVSNDELADRLSDSLGVSFAREELSLPAVRRQITVPANASELSRRFLQHMANQGLGTVSNDRFADLRKVVSDCFEGQSRLDVELAAMASGDHPASSQWYASMSHGGRHGLVQRIASVTLNQDIRCFRCHDGFIDARGKQSDYWSFAGMVFQSLHHQEGSRVWNVTSPAASLDDVKVAANRPMSPSGDVFYDAIDGRRVAAQAGVPVPWLSTAAGGKVDRDSIAASTLTEWGPTLKGSRALAGGLVNVIWRMVHDRPLTQSVADVGAAPRDAKLDELHATLADDLVASNFDIARTLALVIVSPVTRRSIPEAYQVESAGQMADAETEQSYMAFAAAKPFFRRRGMADRLQTILATSGATLDVLKDGGALLAQPAGNGKKPGTLNPKENRREIGERIELQDFPINETEMPVAWLASIEDPQSRLGHVCFMAGRTAIPDGVVEANAAMEEAGIDEPLRLSRLWWMIRP